MIVIEGNLISWKNHRRILRTNRINGRYFVGKTATALQNEKSMLIQLSDARKKFEWQRMMVAAESKPPHRVLFRIFKRTHQRADFLNLIQGIADCLVKSGYLEDDDMQNFLPVFVPHQVDPKHPRTEIEIVHCPDEGKGEIV